MSTNEYVSKYYNGEELIRKSMLERSNIGARYKHMRMSEFNPSENQREAYNAAVEFCENFLSGKNRGEGLLFAGNCGSGKTMLSAAICGEIIARAKLDEMKVCLAAKFGEGCGISGDPTVRFENTVNLLERLRCSFDKFDKCGLFDEFKSTRSIIEECENAPILILDDLGAQKPSGWSGERLYDLINYRYMELLPIIVTTNCRPEELRSALGERIFDRIKTMCRYYPITTTESLRQGKPLHA